MRRECALTTGNRASDSATATRATSGRLAKSAKPLETKIPAQPEQREIGQIKTRERRRNLHPHSLKHMPADVVAETFDELIKAKAWPQNEGVPKANVEGTIKSEKDFGKITKNLMFDDVADLSIALKVVAQLGRVKDFPY